MKASDYYREYKDLFFGTGITPLHLINEYIRELEEDFLDEALEIYKKRNCKTQQAYIRVCREQTNKWNALVRIFEKKHGVSPIKPRNVPFDRGVYTESDI